EEMGGDGGHGASTEQPSAAGYAACFQPAPEQVARRQHVEPGPTPITGNVRIAPTGQGGVALDVELHIFMPGVDKATAEKLVELAHEVCPYSNATRGNIPVKLIVEEQPIAAS